MIAGMSWRALVVRGLVTLVFGILTLLWPGITLIVLVLLFGAYALVDGMAGLVTALRSRSEPQRGLRAAKALLSIAVGLITLLWPSITAVALLVLIAIWALVAGVLEIIAAVRLRGVVQYPWVLGLVGTLSLVLAILLLISPGDGALAITWAIGWYAVLAGTVLLAVAGILQRLERLRL